MCSTGVQLATKGYAVCRGVVSAGVCESIRTDALATMTSVRWRPLYHARRYGLIKGWARVRSPWLRHVVPLTLARSVDTALASLACVLVDAGLPLTSQLVELSAAISLPGAQAQEVHTDISAGTPNVGEVGAAPLVTAWVALQPVMNQCMGPTMVYPGTHRRFAVRSARLEKEYREDQQTIGAMMWSCDPDTVMAQRAAYVTARAQQARKALDADKEREHEEFGPLAEPCSLLLGCGDAAVMDCRIAHCGGAYKRLGNWFARHLTCSGTVPVQVPRVLLNATFSCAEDSTAKFHGFTYHKLSALPALSLHSLLDPAFVDQPVLSP